MNPIEKLPEQDFAVNSPPVVKHTSRLRPKRRSKRDLHVVPAPVIQSLPAPIKAGAVRVQRPKRSHAPLQIWKAPAAESQPAPPKSRTAWLKARWQERREILERASHLLTPAHFHHPH
jgi:hypothetical protein